MSLPVETQQVCKIVLECVIVMKILPLSCTDFTWDDPLWTSDDHFSRTTEHISEALIEIQIVNCILLKNAFYIEPFQPQPLLPQPSEVPE
jgi:hypothetical protein